MQGTTQSATRTIHNQGGTSHEWQATPETQAPPGDPSYRHASGRAVASFVISITALPITWIPFANVVSLALGITAFKLGVTSFKECNRSRELAGSKLAVAGMTLGSLNVVVSLGFAVWWWMMIFMF